MARDIEKANVGLSAEQAEKAGQVLDRLLADQVALYIKTRKYHWNVVGPRFAMLHEFFEDQYEVLDEAMDETAEFTRKFGMKAIGTLKEFQEKTVLKEAPGDNPSEDGMLRDLLEDHENVIRHLRDAINYAADDLKLAELADYFTQVIETHEKMAWMLRSHLG